MRVLMEFVAHSCGLGRSVYGGHKTRSGMLEANRTYVILTQVFRLVFSTFCYSVA